MGAQKIKKKKKKNDWLSEMMPIEEGNSVT